MLSESKIFLFILFLFFSFALITPILSSAHPHPVVYIEGNETAIKILALHFQLINLSYLQGRFVLENCMYSSYEQKIIRYPSVEIEIYIPHNCSELRIKNNTLFKDFWKHIPIITHTEGFAGDGEGEDSNLLFTGWLIPIENPLLLIVMLFLFGIFFAFVGDFFNLILPISLSSKYVKDKYLWLKSGIIHIASTYIVLSLSLQIFAKSLISYIGFIIIFVGAIMLLENYLQRKKVSPFIIAAVPCSGSLFVAFMLTKQSIFLVFLAPLFIGLGELVVLKAGSIIPFPKKYVRVVPFAIMIVGVFLIITLWGVPLIYQGSIASAEWTGVRCEYAEENIEGFKNRLEEFYSNNQSKEGILRFVEEDPCVTNGSIETSKYKWVVSANWKSNNVSVQSELLSPKYFIYPKDKQAIYRIYR